MEGGAVQSPEQRRDALAERIFGSCIGFMEILSIYVGDRLGFYRALADNGGAMTSELAVATGTHERYAREWLEQQAVAGILEVRSADAEPEERRYLLPEGHDEVLLERDSLYYVAPFAQGENFTAPSGEIERLMYGYSILHCLPVGMAEQPSAGTGTVMRPATLRRYASEAGFSGVEIMPIENDLWRFYRLVT